MWNVSTEDGIEVYSEGTKSAFMSHHHVEGLNKDILWMFENESDKSSSIH